MVQRPDLVGQQFGNYKLLRLLGRGGFAEVYLGEHIDLGTQAAIKVLHTQLSPTDIDAFRTEARTIARLVHPHIIRVLDFNAAGSTPFLVMDYAVGGTMRERYPKDTIVPLPTIVSYVQQVADALQYAHDEKLIHRDIKPENILLDKRDNVLLSDFGIALVVQSSRSQNTQEVIGTASYMSPEQIQGKPRAASDQYSLGVVVYEWLSGTRPFEGSLTELWSQHMFAPPPSLRGKAPTVSPEIEHVVMTALAKDPKQRFDSTRAFATALQQAYQAEQAQTLISSHPPRYSWWSQPKFHTIEDREEHVRDAQFPQIPATRESLRVSSFDYWMPEPTAPTNARRNLLGSLTKKSSKKSRRAVVAVLAASSLVGTSTAVVLNLNYLEHLLGLTNQSSTAHLNTNEKNTTPLPTQSAMPTPTNTQNKGTVIGNTQQKANSAVEFMNPATGTPGILVRLPDSTFTAYDKACTHVGVLVNYDPATRLLVCPAHGAIFDPARGGAVVKGPAQSPLPTIAIQVQADGTVTTI